jgi:hypothetical protein
MFWKIGGPEEKKFRGQKLEVFLNGGHMDFGPPQAGKLLKFRVLHYI